MRDGRVIFVLLLVSLVAGCVPAQVAKLPHLGSETVQERQAFLAVPDNYLLGEGDKVRLSLSNEVVPVDEVCKDVYQLEVGDILEINFFNHWEFNVTRTVRPDGFITIPYCGDIKARGMTNEQLAADIAKCYSSILQSPKVTVNLYLLNSQRFKDLEGEYVVQNNGSIQLPKIGRVKASGETLEQLSHEVEKYLSRIYFDRLDVQATLTHCANNRFYIAGEVNKPGIYNIESRLSVLQAIVKAGDVKPGGNLEQVVLIRRISDDIPQVRVLNITDALLSNDFMQDVEVHPYDIIFVPKTNIASLRQFLDDYLFDLLHLSTTMGFYYTKELQKVNF